MAPQALSDVRVIDLTHYVAGPYCTKLLADYGADVIKVERPGTGDPARHIGPFYQDEPHPEKSLLFLHLNTNKRGITLNLKSKTGRRLLLGLVKDADLVVESFAPRVLPSLGLSYETLASVNPRVALVSISNFGQTGPYRDFKASEVVLYAMGGEMYSCGLPDREPVALGPHWIQFQVGSVAAVAAMGAFYGARYQGLGQQVDISMMEVQAGGTERRNQVLVGYQYSGMVEPRMAGTGGGYPSQMYPCQDGYFFMIGGIPKWDRFAELMQSEELKDPKWKNPAAQRDPDLQAEFEAIYLTWLAEHTRVECWQAAQALGITCAPLNTVEDLLKDAHFKEREYWVELEHPATGKLTYPGAPFKMTETPWRARRAAPLLGEHNGEIYGSLGLAKEEMVRLREMGVI
ncbi:MAG: CoA transferase [Chloroflexi bacterium]|nr:CoA transferase [Chloroflexota bacterium]